MKKTEKKNKVHLKIIGRASSVSCGAENKTSKRDKNFISKNLQKIDSNLIWLLGADEVGRGPLAGPVTVCVSKISHGSERKLQSELTKLAGRAYPIGKDSKKMHEKEREFWFEHLCTLEKQGLVTFYIGSKSAKDIDKKRIAVCIRNILNALVVKAVSSKSVHSIVEAETLTATTPALIELRADAGLKTTVPIALQQDIVKGDEKEFIISIASVYAKVSRDRYMKKISKKQEFSNYGFEVHKGYGTLKHRTAIKKYGLSDQHRKSFSSRIVARLSNSK